MFNLLHHLEDDAEVGALIWLLVPAPLHNGPILKWAVSRDLREVRSDLLIDDGGHYFMWT